MQPDISSHTLISARIRHSRPADLVHLPAIERSAAQLFAGTHAQAVVDGHTSHPRTLAHGHESGLLWIVEAKGPPSNLSPFSPAPSSAPPSRSLGGFLLAERCAEGLYIREISVAATAQRRGYGTALVKTAIAHAARRRLAAVLLTTDRTLPWNAPFYARLGFSLCEPETTPNTLRRRLAQQVADGMSPDHRCAMILPLPIITK